MRNFLALVAVLQLKVFLLSNGNRIVAIDYFCCLLLVIMNADDAAPSSFLVWRQGWRELGLALLRLPAIADIAFNA